MELVEVIKSPNSKKKWRAIFSNGKKTDFGDASMQDYTQTGDKEKRHRYILRHMKDLKTDDPTRAGYLSLFILWGKHTDMQQNIKLFKKNFNL